MSRPRRPHLGPVLGLAVAFAALGCSESDAGSQPGSTLQAVSASCGSKGQPDCPLQGWMKDTLRPYLNANDKARLAPALDKLAEHAPSGFDGWEASAKRAADAARAGNIAAVKAECKVCHDQHRSRFRAEMRATRLF